jgi:phosphate transport system substrate-binding protein
LRIGGTGAGLATIGRLADALAASTPGFRSEVVPSLGSSGGLRALSLSRIDVALVSRPLSAAEKAAGLVAVPYGRTALVFASRMPRPEGLTLPDVVAILRGTRTTWPDGSTLRLVLRPAADSDSILLATLSPGVAAAQADAQRREGLLVGSTDQDAADLIEQVPGAVGISSLPVLLAERRPLHALALGGVAPDAASIASGRYPLVKTLFLVTRGEASGAAARLVEFAGSREGLRLLAEAGHAPPR